MESRVLGPIEVIDDDGAVLALGGTRPRALLAALLLEPGLAVSRERLICGLWETPPPSAAHAVELAVDVRLDLGRHDELVPELRMLVGAEPARERLWARLNLALYRCGRQVDALDAFGRVRGRLRDELGIEPGPDLRTLQRRILEHDPGLALPITVAAERALSAR